VRRRRVCLNKRCGRRFTTYERPDVAARMVVKKDGSREIYSREKVLRGMMTACEKRQISVEELNRVADGIEVELFDGSETEVRTSEIGEKVSEALRVLDQVAYVRFTSVYREFADIQAFEKMLQSLRNGISDPRTRKDPRGGSHA
jgi:transcriptional repressor NrdR